MAYKWQEDPEFLTIDRLSESQMEGEVDRDPTTVGGPETGEAQAGQLAGSDRPEISITQVEEFLASQPHLSRDDRYKVGLKAVALKTLDVIVLRSALYDIPLLGPGDDTPKSMKQQVELDDDDAEGDDNLDGAWGGAAQKTLYQTTMENADASHTPVSEAEIKRFLDAQSHLHKPAIDTLRAAILDSNEIRVHTLRKMFPKLPLADPDSISSFPYSHENMKDFFTSFVSFPQQPKVSDDRGNPTSSEQHQPNPERRWQFYKKPEDREQEPKTGGSINQPQHGDFGGARPKKTGFSFGNFSNIGQQGPSPFHSTKFDQDFDPFSPGSRQRPDRGNGAPTKGEFKHIFQMFNQTMEENKSLKDLVKTQEAMFREINAKLEGKGSTQGFCLPKDPNASVNINPRSKLPEKTLVRIDDEPEKPDLSPLARTLTSAGLTAEAASLGVGVAYAIKDSLRKKKPASFAHVPVQTADDMTINDFDYNIQGSSLENIIGPKFMSTRFSSEVSRLTTLRAILQHVINHPLCTPEAKSIAIQGLGSYKIPALVNDQLDMSTMLARASITQSILPEYGDSTDALIPPPMFGDVGVLPSGLLKTLLNTLGNEKISIDDVVSKPLRHVLPVISTTITHNRLTEEMAYLTLLHCLKGDIYNLISNWMTDKTPFNVAWKHIQIMGSTTGSRDTIEAEIRKLIKTRPISLTSALTKLQVLVSKLMAYIDNPAERSLFVKRYTVECIFKLINVHFPSCYSTIEQLYLEKKRAHSLASDLAARQGAALNSDFNEVGTLTEIAVSYVNKRAIGAGETSLIHCVEVEPLPEASVNEVNVEQENGQSVTEEVSKAIIASFNQAIGNMRNQSTYNNNNNARNNYRPRDNSHRSFNNNKNGNYNNNGNNNNNHNSSAQGNSSQVNNQFGNQNMVAGPCFLCNIPGHRFRDCRKYKGERPGNTKCQICQGRHVSQCKYNPNRNQNNNNSYNNNRPDYSKQNTRDRQQFEQRDKDNRRGTVIDNRYVTGNSGNQQRPNMFLANDGRQPVPAAKVSAMEAERMKN